MNSLPHRIRKRKGIKTTCSRCDGPLGSNLGKQRYCRECHNKWRRDNPAPYKPQIGLYQRLTPRTRLQNNARSYANEYLRRGKIQRKPCEQCGAPKSEMHHEDYTKPLQVRWLCRKHHMELHGRISTKQ